jgi:2-methylcitrate dehydratase PrpD
MATQTVVRNYTETLADYVGSTRYEDIPPHVIEHAKKVVLDTTGAIVRAASHRYTAANILSKYALDRGGNAEATLIGQGFRTDAVNAVLVNGTFGYYCDVESILPVTISHPAAVIFPTVLALAESRNLSGKDLLRAFVVGYEVQARVILALGPSALYERNFHPSAVGGTFGAAAAAGSLLGLDAAKQSVAFGLAGCQASGLLAWETDATEHSRPFQMGLAARNGVTSALLAEKGFGGPPNIFEGKYSIFQSFTARPYPERLVEELGQKYYILDTLFKRYSCCGFILSGADGLLEIINKNKLTHENIDSIDLHFAKEGAHIIDNNSLKSHNAQYVLSVLAVNGEVNIDDILEDRTREASISRLSKKVKVVPDDLPDFPQKHSSIVVVKTKDGQSYSENVVEPKGTPTNPLTQAELEEKFLRLTRTEMLNDQARETIKKVNALEGINDIHELTHLLL